MIAKAIKELLCYAKAHLELEESDLPFFEKLLLREFDLSSPYEGEIDETAIAAYPSPRPILDALMGLCLKLGESKEQAQKRALHCLNLVSPLPSFVELKFATLNEIDPRLALDYLSSLSILNGSLLKEESENALVYEQTFRTLPSLLIRFGDGKEEALHQANTRYARIELGEESYRLSYASYPRIDREILLEGESPLSGIKAIEATLDFVNLFPSTFLGYSSKKKTLQGGSPVLPLFKAPVAYAHPLGEEAVATLSFLDFYQNAFRIDSTEKREILSLASSLIQGWEKRTPSLPGERSFSAFALKDEACYSLYLVLEGGSLEESKLLTREKNPLYEGGGAFFLPEELRIEGAALDALLSKKGKGKGPELSGELYEKMKENRCPFRQAIAIACQENLIGRECLEKTTKSIQDFLKECGL